MKIIFTTQSGSLSMFNDLGLALSNKINLDKIGFYISDQFSFENYKEKNSTFAKNNYSCLKEWEIVNDALSKKLDYNILSHYEQKLHGFNLWDSVVGDRYLYFGKKCTLYQDYKSRFSYEELLKILQGGLLSIDKFLKDFEPNIIIGYNCITFGEMLFYYFAKKLKIPYLNLRSAKIENYICYGETIHKNISAINKSYEEYLVSKDKDDEWIVKANNFYVNNKKSSIVYEGIRKKLNKNLIYLPFQIMKNLPIQIRREIRYLFKGGLVDNQSLDPLTSDIYNNIINPIRSSLINLKLSRKYINEKDLKKYSYAFFPLHSEPEVSVMLHNKSFMNQIEAIRLFSHNVPTDMIIIVKDHPVACGKRPASYYKKILDIPNIRMVHPRMNTKVIIENSKIILTVAGSVSFEAILKSKPVISLGLDHHNVLPDSMIKMVHSPQDLYHEIKFMIENYKFDEHALVSYEKLN